MTRPGVLKPVSRTKGRKARAIAIIHARMSNLSEQGVSRFSSSKQIVIPRELSAILNAQHFTSHHITSFRSPSLHSCFRPASFGLFKMARGTVSFPIILDDFQMTTWLAMGALIFAVMVHYLAFWVAIQFPILLLSIRIVKTMLISKGVISAPPSNTLPGRYTTQIPESKGEKQKGVVMFVLGARINQ